MNILTLMLLAVAMSTHNVHLSWLHSDLPGIKYQSVMRQGGCAGHWRRVTKLSPTDDTWSDTSVAQDKTYCYVITATDAFNETRPVSDVVKVQTKELVWYFCDRNDSNPECPRPPQMGDPIIK